MPVDLARLGPDARAQAERQMGTKRPRRKRSRKPTDPKLLAALHMTEADLLAAVIGCAHAYGRMVAHFRPAQTPSGRWMTPVQGDGKGFMDCIIPPAEGKAGKVIAAELKREVGTVEPAQQIWLAAMERGGCEVYVWRPSDWLSGAVERALQ